MSNIFVSYRRSDAAGHAGRLMDDLEREFPRSQIFRDLESIEAGTDFVQAIENAVGQSVVLLAIMGPRWLSVADEAGARRLDNAGDFVRHEIAAALRRNIRVIPVLVDGCEPPPAEQLPVDIATLARLQAHELSEKRWDYDVEQLMNLLGRMPGLDRQAHRSVAPASRAVKMSFRTAALLVSAAIVLVVAVGLGAMKSIVAVAEPDKRTDDERTIATHAKTATPVETAKATALPKPIEPPPKPSASADAVRLHLALATSKAADGGWPVYAKIDQVGGNGTERRCRVHPADDVFVTCRHERLGQKISLVLRIESTGCSGFVTSDAFVHDKMLPQRKLATLPDCL